MSLFNVLSFARGARRVRSLSGLCAPFLLLLGLPAPAQEASDASGQNLQEVVVTGIRRGIEDAIEVKKDSLSIVEAVSAEDIGKLPDTSIAESISRLPGLTSQRAQGRASAISLRGTDPAFTNGLLNGREQVSTGDNRSIEFDQYPSELLSAVVVYKTPDAALIGQGLAGTIDLQTTRPLEYGRRAIAFNLRGERNSNNDLGANSTDKGYRFSASYIDQFADDTVGITLGIARLDSPLATEGEGTYEPWHQNNGEHAGVPAGVFVTDGMKVRTDMGKNVRTGALATLEWRPNSSFTSMLDAYYTKSDETDDARSLEWNLGNYPATTVYTDLVIRENTLIGANVSAVRPLVRNFQFITDDKITALGWNNKWKGADWTLTGDLSYSKAQRDQFQPETNAQWGNCPGGGDPACTDSGSFILNGGAAPSFATFTRDYADPAQVARPDHLRRRLCQEAARAGRAEVSPNRRGSQRLRLVRLLRRDAELLGPHQGSHFARDQPQHARAGRGLDRLAVPLPADKPRLRGRGRCAGLERTRGAGGVLPAHHVPHAERSWLLLPGRQVVERA